MSTKMVILFGLALASAASAQTCPATAVIAQDAVAAKINGEIVRVAAVDAEIADALCTARLEQARQVAELRSTALEHLIDQRLLKIEAKARELPNVEALVLAAVAKAPTPTEAAKKALYEENKDRLEGRTYAQVAEEIDQFLGQKAQQEAVETLVAELRKKHRVEVELEPFRVPIAPGGITHGPADAPVTIVEFADFQCGFCARAAPTVKALKARYGDKIRWTFRDFPLEFHPRAVPAAVAARCAGRQGKYWAMHDKLFENSRSLQDADLAKYAHEVGVDLEKFAQCQGDPAVAQAVREDHAAGRQVGVSGTPAFFINGIALTGAQPVEAFVPIIERELKRR